MPIFFAKRFASTQTGVFLEGAAAGLIFWDLDLASARDEHADGGEVDVAKDGFHEASGEQGDARSFGLVGADKSPCVLSGAFHESGAPGRKQGMDGEVCPSGDSRGKSGEVHERRICGEECAESKGGRRVVALRFHVRVTRLLEEFAVGNPGWAGRLAGEATDAFGGVVIGPSVRGHLSLELVGPQPDATARGVVLIAGELVGRADGETETAMGAV